MNEPQQCYATVAAGLEDDQPQAASPREALLANGIKHDSSASAADADGDNDADQEGRPVEHRENESPASINTSETDLQNGQQEATLSELNNVTGNLLPSEQHEPCACSNGQLDRSSTGVIFNSNNVSTNNNNNINNTSDTERRYRPQKYCAVCGDKAIACNFNAVTCESCKAFFRRNAFKEQRLKCLFENCCIIDRVTRRFCSKCRLLKCFQIGMKREWILTDEQKQIKRVKIMQNKQCKQRTNSSPSVIQSDDEQEAHLSSVSPGRLQQVSDCKPTVNNSFNGRSQSGNKKQKLLELSKSIDIQRTSTVISRTASNRAPVETRDAATSCPDEWPADLMANEGGGRLIQHHYCSFASHCQYCALRLTGGLPGHLEGCNGEQPTPLADYHHHHNHHHHHHQLNERQIQVARIQHHYSPSNGNTVGNGLNGAPHLPTSNGSYPITVIAADEQQSNGGNSLARNIQRSPASARFLSFSNSPVACCCLDSINNQNAAVQFNQSTNSQYVQQPQFHLMASSQTPMSVLVTPDNVPYGVFGAQNFVPVGHQVISGDKRAAVNNGDNINNGSTSGSPETNTNTTPLPVDSSVEVQASLIYLQTPAYSQPRDASSASANDLGDQSAPSQLKQQGSPISGSDTNSEELLKKELVKEISGENKSVEKQVDETNRPTSTSSETNRQSNDSDSANTSQQQEEQNQHDDREPDASTSIQKSGYIVWDGEFYSEPAQTEQALQSRLEKLDFLESDMQLICELIEATRFMFEMNSEHKNSRNSLNDIVHFCDAALRRLIKTVKQIKAFRMLNMDDQILLLKTASFKILLLRSTFHYADNVEGWIDAKSGRIMRLDILKLAKKSLVYERHFELVKKIPEPLRKDRLIMSIMSMALLFDPNIDLKHSNSVSLDNLIYLSMLRKYLIYTQPDPLNKYQNLVSALKVINACNEEYNVFFSKDFQPEQITPLLIEIFDISTA